MNKTEARIQAGLCTRCGQRSPIPNGRMCEECRTYLREYAAKEWRSPAGKRKRRARLKAWQRANPEKTRKRARRYYHEARAKVFDHYGHVCQCCGETNDAFLTIDHINDDGKGDHDNLYRRIVAAGFPPGLQTLCWNCNQAKRIYGVCPHNSVVRKSASHPT